MADIIHADRDKLAVLTRGVFLSDCGEPFGGNNYFSWLEDGYWTPNGPPTCKKCRKIYRLSPAEKIPKELEQTKRYEL